MNINIRKPFILVLFTSILFFSCSKENKVDLSNLPVIEQKEEVKTNKSIKNNFNSNNEEFIKDLVPLNHPAQILSEFKIGKKDPFSEDETQIDQFSQDFKLTGFLNTEFEKYVFVSFLGNEGTISEDSIGGLNTNLLPNGARVIEIDTKKRQLKISYDNEDFIFEL